MTTSPLLTMTNHLGIPAKGGARLCGEGRTAGSVYVESAIMLGGKPIESFIPDPLNYIDPVQFNINAVGVRFFEDHNGVTHIVDWVGSSHYEYPADFIEEAALMGVSRKIAANATDLKKLSAASTMILIHAKGYMYNHQEVGGESQVLCPNGNLGHTPGAPCSGLHWVIPSNTPDGEHRSLSGDARYEVTPRSGTATPLYEPGIILVVPITHLTVIANHDGSVNQKALAAVKAAVAIPNHVSPI